ncbi:peptidoglycan-binding domain-containing protein [Roseicitreum antarcticum]|uniref:Putative peptidoglycan binding domain-containing protein n=1 Tax=Roseicitreum antarcticum TaxID=564137 RepID=A0A1H2RJV6_9RHOB|nr:peptidoglycan-binding domain-containing protein [Roseicitreum antarcticum]SDW18919.1 Putative peptidoglycan binding domain-containing protein [Roseicitreum antarcticum]
MAFKKVFTFLTAASLLVAPAHQAAAQDGFVGGIIGGIIGGAIANDQRRRTTQQTVRRTVPGATSAQREQNRGVQTALNLFGFNVGTPDGSIGPRSRAGISQYQAFLGYAATGQITDIERNILTTAHQRAIMGGPIVSQTISTHPQGMRGMLLLQRDEMMGHSPARSAGNYGLPAEVAAAVDEIARSSDPTASQLVERSGFIQLADINSDGRTDYILDTSVTGSAFWCNAQACTVRVFASTPDGYARNDFQAFNATPAMFTCQRGDCSMSGAINAPATVAVAAPVAPSGGAVTLPVASAQPVVSNPGAATSPAMPNFFGGAAAAPSLASHCNRTSLATTNNGGYTTVANLTDPRLALSEQFCLARTYAIAEGEELAQQVPGVTPQQISAQCDAFGPSLKPFAAAMSLQEPADVLRDVSDFALQTGMSPAQLSGTAKICLSAGYRGDNMDVAIGSGLLLVALGEPVYAELMGHHLAQGFGANTRLDLAKIWFSTGLGSGQRAVYAAGQPDRDALIHQAVLALDGGAMPPVPLTPVAPAVPVFNLIPAQ